MLLISNWKGYVETSAQARALARAANAAAEKSIHKIIICPSMPYVALVKQDVERRVAIGVQDISVATAQAATGEVSGSLARSAGAMYAIIGHSERRALGESNAVVAAKVNQALAASLIPVICVGEQQRDADAHYLEYLREQIYTALANTAAMQGTSSKQALCIIAYEPLWAIGKSAANAIQPHDLQEMVGYIKKVATTAGFSSLPVLYGGAVDGTNAAALADGTGIDGFLVGRASTTVKTFSALVRALTIKKR